jgi:hypothetical protein
MALWLNDADVEARLAREAVIRGLTPSEYAARILDDHLPALLDAKPVKQEAAPCEKAEAGDAPADAPRLKPPHPLNGRDGFYSPTLALFDAWALEDATDDPEELERRQREGDELLASLANSPVRFREVVLDLDAYD